MEELEISLRSELSDLKDRLKKTASAVSFFTSESEWSDLGIDHFLVEKISGLRSAIDYIETRLREEF